MELLCHRCSATLEPDGFYCPQCGAPQVRFVAQESGDLPLNTDIGKDPPLHVPTAERTRLIHWRLAIRIAILVAICVGVLSTLLAAGSVLWVAVGAVVVIGMYHRRQPQAWLDTRIGARIGAVVGLLAASVSLTGNAALLVIQRFAMHQGNQIDLQLTSIVKQAAEHASAMDPQAPVMTFTNFWLSAEGRIGLILLTMGFLSVLILLFAIAGGVLGAQIYRSPRGRKTVH